MEGEDIGIVLDLKLEDYQMVRKKRAPNTINTKGLTPHQYKSEDSVDGESFAICPTFRLEPEALADLNAIAEAEGIARAVLLRRAIKQFLKEYKANA